MDDKSSKIVPINKSISNTVSPESNRVKMNINKRDNGGETPMEDDYVTHKELDHAVEKLSDKMDLMEAHIDTKFSNQKVWYLGILLTIVLSGLFFK